MGTKLIAISESRKYRHHPLAFKRQVVEQSRLPNTSVAQVAQEHGINANQIFAWRRAYSDGRLGEPNASNLVEVHVAAVEDLPLPSQAVEQETGVLTITVGSAVMTATGNVNPSLFRCALNELLAQ